MTNKDRSHQNCDWSLFLRKKSAPRKEEHSRRRKRRKELRKRLYVNRLTGDLDQLTIEFSIKHICYPSLNIV